MAQVKTSFIPQANGFRFVNRFKLPFPVKFRLPLAGEIDLNKVVYGLCGGMCFSALDYYHAGEKLPDYAQPDEIDARLFAYLCDRQLDSLGIPVLIKVLEWMLRSPRDVSLRIARYEIPKIKRMLDRGEPVVLALVRVQGVGDPTQNHQVLATGYHEDPQSREFSIQLYDPNHPGQQPELKMNLEHPSQGIDLEQTSGEFLRGFFVINYSPQLNLPRPPAPQADVSFGFGAPSFSLRWPVDSQRVNQYFGENPDTYKPFGLPGHEGLDLFALTGANVYAAADGEVYQAGHPKDHPYGLHVRIKHPVGGKTYHTIYAHLSDTNVQVGQQVSAGDLIGKADNTGNSFGSHLHLTLKIDGEQTPGYPAGIVDPWPFLKESHLEPPPPPEPAKPLPPPSGITVYTTTQLNLRSQSSTDSQILGLLPAGEGLSVLGKAEAEKAKIGQQGQWLQVQTAGGLAGHVAAWFVQTIEQGFPPSDLVVYPMGALNLRSGPSTAFEVLANLTEIDPLTVLGDANNGRSKIGKQGQWLQVQTQNGTSGFVAAWLVHTTAQALPTSDLAVHPTVALNLRARPSIDSNRLTVVAPGDSLTVLGDQEAARALIGSADQWLSVRTPGGYQGFVAAWLVKESQGAAPPPPPAGDQLTLFPTADLNIRAQPSVNSPRVGGAFRNSPLSVVEADLEAARQRVGAQDEWIHVELEDGTRGWAAAWFLSAAQS
jgi:murein DD-endopeptidase MepM/ murein hydrolase activator NlpD/uncharacterized protein YraI